MDDIEQVLAAGQQALQDRWPGCRLRDPQPFHGQGSSRNVVLRAAVSGGGAASVVVKRHRSGAADEWAVREPAALSMLPRDGGFLQLLAAGEDLIVLADLGDGGHLADRLLGDDAAAATDGVIAWAGAIGRLHCATAGRAADFEAALAAQAARSARPVPAADPMPGLLADTAEALAEQLPAVEVRPDVAALDELRGVADLLGGGAAARALTPADACPDNNAYTSDGLVLLDFEAAAWRHVAWDAAYLLVPWPSCWCSWQLPDDVAAAGLAAWRTAAGVRYPGLEDDLRAARVAWSFISSAWFLERALAGDAPIDREAPTRRAMITHRMQGVVRDPDPRLPRLAALAGQVIAAATAAWGAQPLALAPAFRGR